MPRYLVQDFDGRVAQDPPGVAAVVEHAADAAVDDVGEVAVERADMSWREGRGWRLQIALT
jgi:hypothetical protein